MGTKSKAKRTYASVAWIDAASRNWQKLDAGNRRIQNESQIALRLSFHKRVPDEPQIQK